MLKSIEEQINKGNLLIEKAKSFGSDTKPLEIRVKKLKSILKEQLSEQDSTQSVNIPSWYTEEDRKAKEVLNGICKSCAHLLIVKDNDHEFELNGFWCTAYKKKLEIKLENCHEYYPLSDEIDRIIKNLGIRT